MKILALDLATNTGVSVGTPGTIPLCFSEHLGGPPDERRFSNVIRLTSRLIKEHEPDFIAVEAAIGGSTSSQYLVGLLACVKGVAFMRGVPCEAMPIQSIRKHFLGKHLTAKSFPGLPKAKAKAEIKNVVMARAKAIGANPKDHDAADAVALWDYACATKAPRYQAKPVGGLFG